MKESIGKDKPCCPVFDECGGCQYQEIPYSQELLIKQNMLNALFVGEGLASDMISEVEPSPREYNYRCRLDMKFLKIRSGEMFMGFSPVKGFRVVEVNACPIAMESLSAFLPELRRQACSKIPAKYRNANLTVKTGDDGRVFWGGIGRKSLRMSSEDYLWTEINGLRIFYSLETFFQANLSILPRLIDVMRSFNLFTREKIFLDLYGGVGLFGLCFAGEVRQVFLIEENIHSIKCARHNVEYQRMENVKIIEGRVEDKLGELEGRLDPNSTVTVIDPPRAGLSGETIRILVQSRMISDLFYLSCNPRTLVRDIKELTSAGWTIAAVIPFDFFPKTKHLETLVLLKNGMKTLKM